MNEYKGQHHVIIDGIELTPIQSNFVVETIETQYDYSLTDMLSSDVDSIEKEGMAPALLSLAEVIAQINPELLAADIAIDDKGRASFTGVLKSFNEDRAKEENEITISKKDESHVVEITVPGFFPDNERVVITNSQMPTEGDHSVSIHRSQVGKVVSRLLDFGAHSTKFDT